MSGATTELKAVLHVHSTYSDGRVEPGQIARTAREAGLDVVILTDHNSLEARHDGWQRYVDDVLMVVDVELSRRRQPHVLGLGLDEVPPEGPYDEQQMLSFVRRHHGTAVLAHPQGLDKFRFRMPAWQHWDSGDYDGIELWSYVHDWIEKFSFWKIFRFHRDPHAQITGPAPEVLEHWDRVGQTRRVAGLGALDAHAKTVPLLGLTFFPYEHLFRTVRTHLLVEPPTRAPADDVEAVHHAIAEGRCFISYLPNGDASGFSFEGRTDAGQILPMGSEHVLSGPVTLTARSPLPSGRLVLLKDGHPVTQTQDQTLTHTTDTPGVYRIESRRGTGPWVYTNPVYLRVRSAECGVGSPDGTG